MFVQSIVSEMNKLKNAMQDISHCAHHSWDEEMKGKQQTVSKKGGYKSAW